MGSSSSAKPFKNCRGGGESSLQIESRDRLVDCILEIPFLLKKKGQRPKIGVSINPNYTNKLAVEIEKLKLLEFGG